MLEHKGFKRKMALMLTFTVLFITLTSSPMNIFATEQEEVSEEGIEKIDSFDVSKESIEKTEISDVSEENTEKSEISDISEENIEKSEISDVIEESTEGIVAEKAPVKEGEPSKEEKAEDEENSVEDISTEELTTKEEITDFTEESKESATTETDMKINESSTESIDTHSGEKENLRNNEQKYEDKHKVVRTDAIEIDVPIYNYDIVNVVVPTSYAVALNPYKWPIRVNDTVISTNQVTAKNYGIINKSTSDKIVTVTFRVEDKNGGKLTFVDSEQAALNADKDTYAVYLTAVPADFSGVKTGSGDIDKNTTAADLADVFMNGSKENAVVLKEGESQISFKLSKAVYQYDNGRDICLGETEAWNAGVQPNLTELAVQGTGVTAFTFAGVMNEHADWGKLGNGIRISVLYSYETASGEEKIVEGTGAMVREN